MKIFCRRTEEWGNLDHCPTEQIDKLTPERRQQVYANLDQWERDYRLPYTQFRAGLRSISQSSWDNTGLPVSRAITPDTIVIPSDDDDWFCPSLASELEEAFSDPSVELVYWDCWRYYPWPLPEYRPWCGGQWDCVHPHRERFFGSNGYAVRGATKHIIHSHEAAYRSWQPTGKIIYLPQPLSVWLRYPGSLYLMGAGTLNTSRSPYPLDRPPPGLDWTEEYLYQLQNLVAQL